MSESGSLVVGIGSPHGDDGAGWHLIDRLEAVRFPSTRLRKASVPHDMIDWLDDCRELQVVDAYDARDANLAATVQRLELIAGSQHGRPHNIRSAGSHQFDLWSVLELARALARLPDRVTVWTIPGKRFGKGDQISDACAGQVKLCAELMLRQLQTATQSTR